MSRRTSPLILIDEAIHLLATGEHGIKQRLLTAYVQKLQHISTPDVPAELLPMLTAIQKRFGRKPDQTERESAVAAKSALDRMTASQAVKLAKSIVEFNAVFAGSLYH